MALLHLEVEFALVAAHCTLPTAHCPLPTASNEP